MIVMYRPSRPAVVFITLVLMYLVFVLIPDGTAHLKSSSKLETAPSPNHTSHAKVELVEDAHRLPTANSFLPHFKAVTQMQPMTMQEAKSGCNWPATEKVNFQYHEDTEWALHERSDEEIETRRSEWHSFVDNELLPYDAYKDQFEGRGIVIVAGNEWTLIRSKVLLKALAKLGSQMPVEIHYWGHEMTEESQRNLSASWSNIYFNDLAAPSNIFKTQWGMNGNYHFKTAAMLNSRFAEPLLLDSDNIPVIDPESLYESSIYKEFGTLFWPDIARTRPSNPMWSITNTKCRMDEYEQESGQVLIDKRKFFYHLQLASWFNNRHGGYYNAFLLGDKDMFRFTWHALKTKYGFPPKWVTSVGTLTQGFYCGHSFAQHHPDGRVAFMHGGLLKTMAKEVMKWQRESRGGVYQAYKRSDHDEQHKISEEVGFGWDNAEYLPNRPAELNVAWCIDFPQVSTRSVEEIAPGFETTFDESGGYWILNK